MVTYRKIIDVFIFFFLFIVLSLIVWYSIPMFTELYSHPLEKSHTQRIHLQYPDPTTTLPLSVHSDFTYETISLFSVDVFLRYNEPLIEGTIVSVGSTGYLYPRGQARIGKTVDYSKNIIYTQAVVVGFEGASELDNPQLKYINPEGQFWVSLINASSPQVAIVEDGKDFPILINISWDTQGYFSPYVLFPDAVSDSTIPITFNKKIHVGGSDVLRQERYSEINTWLTFVLFAFTFVTGLKFLYTLFCRIILDW